MKYYTMKYIVYEYLMIANIKSKRRMYCVWVALYMYLFISLMKQNVYIYIFKQNAIRSPFLIKIHYALTAWPVSGHSQL